MSPPNLPLAKRVFLSVDLDVLYPVRQGKDMDDDRVEEQTELLRIAANALRKKLAETDRYLAGEIADPPIRLDVYDSNCLEVVNRRD